MNKGVGHRAASQEISYPRFAAFYTWMTDRPQVARWEDPLRRETAGQAQGIVLEVGVGGGQNLPFYDATRVVRVEATEPDEAMQVVARRRVAEVPVPITLTNAAVEALPFLDAQFDSVVATLVFCSVRDPGHGLREIWHVLIIGIAIPARKCFPLTSSSHRRVRSEGTRACADDDCDQSS